MSLKHAVQVSPPLSVGQEDRDREEEVALEFRLSHSLCHAMPCLLEEKE